MAQKNPTINADDVKRFLHIQKDTEDALIGQLIAQAQTAVDYYCGRQFDKNAPEAVRLAELLMVRYDFENRDRMDHQTYTKMCRTFEDLLYPYRNVEESFESLKDARHACMQTVCA